MSNQHQEWLKVVGAVMWISRASRTGIRFNYKVILIGFGKMASTCPLWRLWSGGTIQGTDIYNESVKFLGLYPGRSHWLSMISPRGRLGWEEMWICEAMFLTPLLVFWAVLHLDLWTRNLNLFLVLENWISWGTLCPGSQLGATPQGQGDHERIVSLLWISLSLSAGNELTFCSEVQEFLKRGF